MEPPRDINPYAPPATECSGESPSIDELRKRLVKTHEDCGALAVAWGILAVVCAAVATSVISWISAVPTVAVWTVAVALTWRIRPAGVILGLVLTYLLILGPLVLHPGLSLMLGLVLGPLVFQGHRILWNARILRRAGVELRPS